MRFYVREKAYGNAIYSSEDIYGSLKNLAKADQESFWVIGFNGNNKEVFRECVALGGTDKTGWGNYRFLGREKTAAVKKHLRKQGYNVLKVGHHRGTAWGWLRVCNDGGETLIEIEVRR